MCRGPASNKSLNILLKQIVSEHVELIKFTRRYFLGLLKYFQTKRKSS
ncbi:hypothetical protein ETAE_2023 [Edwardsiella piscicida]|uniref:Uncharacterized protein n=1 Tax=Edwardsiella piscicida TaxID=1263550 RepID=A0AAU8P433_EDWPI|nr:hypothetical protein ETAE_2023 [Edwardsiella tarda EIB202]